MNPRYALVAERARHRCEYCCAPEAIFNFPFEVEHIEPTSRGGADSEPNWALCCRACNLFKTNRVAGIDPETGETVPLFHPRREAWAQHFTVAERTGSLIGLTPAGRATVGQLRLNSPTQRAARAQWMRLKIFPDY